MTPVHASTAEVHAAAHALGALNVQSRAVLAELKRLRRCLDETHVAVSQVPPSQLRATNEQLVLATLAAEAIAETALGSLKAATLCAHRDPLTGLLNRILLMDRLAVGIALARRNGKRLGVLFIDIDNFKAINDRAGHAAGDQVLRFVADRILSVVRSSDTVGRYGGDEFLVVLSDVADHTAAQLVARKIETVLGETRASGAPGVAVSIGIALFPDDGEHPEDLIHRADAVMYAAKRGNAGDLALGTERGAERVAASDDLSLPAALASLVNRKRPEPGGVMASPLAG